MNRTSEKYRPPLSMPIRIPEVEERDRKMFKEVVADNFPNLMKTTHVHIQNT